MITADDFNSTLRAGKEVEVYLTRIEKLERRLRNVGSLIITDSVKHTKKPSDFSNIIAKIELEKEKYLQKIEELNTKEKKVEQYINTIENKNLHLILHYRYLSHMTLPAIAIKLDLSIDWVKEMHSKFMKTIPDCA